VKAVNGKEDKEFCAFHSFICWWQAKRKRFFRCHFYLSII